MDIKNLKNVASPKYRAAFASVIIIGGGSAYLALSSLSSTSEKSAGVGQAKVNLNTGGEKALTKPSSDEYEHDTENSEIARIYEKKREDERQAALKGSGSYVFTINAEKNENNDSEKEEEKVKDIEDKHEAEKPSFQDLINKTKNPVKVSEEEKMDSAPKEVVSYQQKLLASRKVEDRDGKPIQSKLNSQSPSISQAKNYGQVNTASGSGYDTSKFMQEMERATAFQYKGDVEEVYHPTRSVYTDNKLEDALSSQDSAGEGSGKQVAQQEDMDAGGYRSYLGGNLVETEISESFHINAGDIAYTRLQIGINTDEPSPVRAEILSGDLQGGVLLGEPQRVGEKAVINLTKMIFEDEEYQIDAVALDLESKRTGLSDEVDTHFASNMFYLGIASILSGYSDSLQEYEEESSDTSDTETTTKQRLDKFGDRVMVGLGEAGEEAKDIFKDRINREPTVIVYPKDIGIMFMSSIDIKR